MDQRGRGDPMNRDAERDDVGGMADEFVDTPQNEPGSQREPRPPTPGSAAHPPEPEGKPQN